MLLFCQIRTITGILVARASSHLGRDGVQLQLQYPYIVSYLLLIIELFRPYSNEGHGTNNTVK